MRSVRASYHDITKIPSIACWPLKHRLLGGPSLAPTQSSTPTAFAASGNGLRIQPRVPPVILPQPSLSEDHTSCRILPAERQRGARRRPSHLAISADQSATFWSHHCRDPSGYTGVVAGLTIGAGAGAGVGAGLLCKNNAASVAIAPSTADIPVNMPGKDVQKEALLESWSAIEGPLHLVAGRFSKCALKKTGKQAVVLAPSTDEWLYPNATAAHVPLVLSERNYKH